MERVEAHGNDGSGDDSKEFYTIETKSEKVFYLIIDHSDQGNADTVYFLTEVSENDLLNTVESDGAAQSSGLVGDT